MPRVPYQPTRQDNERFINATLVFDKDNWVSHAELKDRYDQWMKENLPVRTQESSPAQRSALHAQIRELGGVRDKVRGISNYIDGRKERMHLLGVGVIDQMGTAFQYTGNLL